MKFHVDSRYPRECPVFSARPQCPGSGPMGKTWKSQIQTLWEKMVIKTIGLGQVTFRQDGHKMGQFTIRMNPTKLATHAHKDLGPRILVVCNSRTQE